MSLNKRIGLFKRLEIETFSMCNRRCVTCLRNSIPDRESVVSWFEPTALPIEDIRRILVESQAMGFTGEVCLSHYNEPLMDDRIIDIVKMVRTMNFSRLFFCSNADFLTEEIASQLDGLVDDIGFSFYMDEPQKSQRMKWCSELFKKTKAKVGPGDHMVTHFSPIHDVIQISQKYKNKPCHLPQVRMIVNHKGQMLLCCDDLTGNFDLGTIYDGKTIEELWYSEKHQQYVISLMNDGGRSIHSHCSSCPRG